jgi:hypothetical protein
MADIPTKVLSQHLQSVLGGRRIAAGLFTTFTLETDFFEEEVVSILAGDALIQEPKVRLLQLEESLRGEIGPLAVYYDPKGLRLAGSKKLDIRYVPVRISTGVFHPKVIVLLVEETDSAHPVNTCLICGVLSANLTKSGWWSNLECAHFEEIVEGKSCSFRDDLLAFLKFLRKNSGRERDHAALELVRKWLRNVDQSRNTELRDRGRLRPQLFAGTEPLASFLKEVRGDQLNGASLEIISPFIDESDPRALRELVRTLGTREARVFLPSAHDATALVKPELYDALTQIPGCVWGQLPNELLKLGKEKNTNVRGVHAKLYRFHKKSARYEALVVGSHNLTSAALSRGGNYEASFVIEREQDGQLDWWLSADTERPRQFVAEARGDDEPTTEYVPLQLAYHWDTNKAEAFWGKSTAAANVLVESAGSRLFTIPHLPSNEWIQLEVDSAEKLESILKSTSLLEAVNDQQVGLVLVQEYGMSRKPSIILNWTVSEVLEYWSRLTPEQRASYLLQRGGNMPEGLPADLGDISRLISLTSFFDTYAGIFHGFEMLRKQVNQSLDANRYSQADYLLFGKRHDSLPSLIDKVLDPAQSLEPLQSYLILLSARQLLREYRKSERAFFAERRREINDLLIEVGQVNQFRSQLDLGDDAADFAQWFERHFNKRLHSAEHLA